MPAQKGEKWQVNTVPRKRGTHTKQISTGQIARCIIANETVRGLNESQRQTIMKLMTVLNSLVKGIDDVTCMGELHALRGSEEMENARDALP